MKKCWSMRQLRPETGESLALFQNTNKIYMLCVLIILLTVSKRLSKLRIIQYELKKCPPLI